MLRYIDEFLNRTTMYRVVLYCLVAVWCAGLLLSLIGLVPFGPFDLIISSTIIYAATIAINKIFAMLCSAPANPESTYITGLILSLIVGPEKTIKGYVFLVLISFLAIASKYLIAIQKKHLFNPAAFSIVVSSLVFGYYASWWIGNPYLFWFVLMAGLLVARKLQRYELVISFFVIFFITSLGGTLLKSSAVLYAVKDFVFYSPIMFFATIMLTEPSTTPPKKISQILYGSLVAILQAPFVHPGNFYFAPESALIASNIFSYLVSPKEKLVLKLREKILVAANTYDFVFDSRKRINYKAGQYMEWSLPHTKRDTRGMRRYFTIAAAPTEENMRIGVKFYPVRNTARAGAPEGPVGRAVSNGVYEKQSSFKMALFEMKTGDTLVASQLAGEFVLPNDRSKGLVFMAGGIGVTPFRSMIKYLLDNHEQRNIVVFYSAKTYADIAYKEIFDRAEVLGVKTIYILNDDTGVPQGFTYEKGVVTEQILKQYAPDFTERAFYISGPKGMIDAFKTNLKKLGIKRRNIKTDFFPGYA